MSENATESMQLLATESEMHCAVNSTVRCFFSQAADGQLDKPIALLTDVE